MTRRGKCDKCCVRKVKCDQERPCGACCKKGRPCTYQAASFFEEHCDPVNGSHCFSSSHPRGNVPLSIARSARSGHGTRYNYTTEKQRHNLADSARLLSSDESRRAAKWISIITENPSGWSWFDGFLCSVTALIGSESVIDSAIDFTLKSHAALRHKWDPAWVRTALESGIAAMAALRRGLDTKPPPEKNTIVTRTGLLCVAEFFRAMAGIKNYVLHMQACATLLSSCATDESCTEVEEALLYMIFLEEVGYSILRGRCSIFTTRKIPRLQSLTKHGVEERCAATLSETMKLLIRLSELGVSPHQFEEQCEDCSKIMDIVASMQSLYEADDEVEAQIEDYMATTLTKCPLIVPESYTFPSPYEFDLAIHYFTYRILLCGMIQSFCDTLLAIGSDFRLPFDTIAAVQEEEEEMCRKVAMCIDYSQECAGAIFAPLRFVTVLRHAHGSLGCIQMRNAAEGQTEEAIEAGRLRDLCYQSCSRTLRMWGMGSDDVLLSSVMELHTRQASNGLPDCLRAISMRMDA